MSLAGGDDPSEKLTKFRPSSLVAINWAWCVCVACWCGMGLCLVECVVVSHDWMWSTDWTGEVSVGVGLIMFGGASPSTADGV